MTQTLKIGNIALDSNVILAPMSGVTDRPFRTLVKKLGSGLVVSEMIASQAMVRQTRQSMQMIQKSPLEEPMAVQLAGNDPEVMAEAAKLNQDLGAKIIDINFGCPVKKVAVKSYAGSALMKPSDEGRAAKILEATVKAVDVPVTLKMRKGWNTENQNAPRLAKIAEESGIQMITVHGRTRCQLYRGEADWEFISNVKEAVKLPVIVNGDITNYDKVDEALKLSNADGVMVGRACYGRPWFIGQVMHYLKTGERLGEPPINQRYEIIREHLDDMFSFYGEGTGVRIARKHMAWYGKGLDGSAEYRATVNRSESASAMINTIDEYFKRFL